MKRLLGLLLVMGMLGCGKPTGGPPPSMDATTRNAEPSPATPNKPPAKIDEPPVQTVDFSKLVERDGLMYEGDSETPFTGGVVAKHENGQKQMEGTFEDGKPEGLATSWHENGQKRSEVTHKDGKPEGLMTGWYDTGQKSLEVTFKDGKPEGLATSWHENGQKEMEGTFKDGKEVSKTEWDEEGNEATAPADTVDNTPAQVTDTGPVAALEKQGATIVRNEWGDVVQVHFVDEGNLITDAGLIHLKGLTKLQVLTLGLTKVTDAGLVHLKGLPNLERLHLPGQTTDAGLAQLKGLDNLWMLLLIDTQVTDAGLIQLKDLPNLRVLILAIADENKVTEAGLVHLKKLTGIQKIVLPPHITDAGVADLKKALPNCDITRGFL